MDWAISIQDLHLPLNATLALDVPRLEFPRGETTVLAGASAAGKSALLKLVGRVDEPYFDRPRRLRGRALLSAERLGPEPLDLLALDRPALLRRRVLGPVLGFVFQNEALFTFCDLLENVAWPLREQGVPRDEAGERARGALADVGLSPERSVTTLSGGERKKLALARALAPDPDVLFLDEPFTGLDPVTQRSLVELMAAQRGRRTAVVVSHQRLPYEALADHVALMARGQVVRAGSRAAMEDTMAAFHDGKLRPDDLVGEPALAGPTGGGQAAGREEGA